MASQSLFQLQENHSTVNQVENVHSDSQNKSKQIDKQTKTLLYVYRDWKKMFLSWPGMNCHGSPLYYSVKKNSVTEQEENKNAQPYIDIS